MYICTHVNMYICTHEYVYVNMYIDASTYIMYIHILYMYLLIKFAKMYMFVFSNICIWHMYLRIHISYYLLHIYVNMYTCKYVNVNVYRYIFMSKSKHTYTHIRFKYWYSCDSTYIHIQFYSKIGIFLYRSLYIQVQILHMYIRICKLKCEPIYRKYLFIFAKIFKTWTENNCI